MENDIIIIIMIRFLILRFMEEEQRNRKIHSQFNVETTDVLTEATLSHPSLLLFLFLFLSLSICFDSFLYAISCTKTHSSIREILFL